MQAWKIGKPPTIAWEGIGFDVNSAPLDAIDATADYKTIDPITQSPLLAPVPSSSKDPRPSMSSSEYDDLADFNGRFSSSSNLPQTDAQELQAQQSAHPVKKKTSFLALFDGRHKRQASLSATSSRPSTARSDSTPPPLPSPASPPKLRGSKSKSSLRSKSSMKLSNYSKARSTPPIPEPPHLNSRDINSLPPLPNSEELTLADLGFDITALDSPTLTDWDVTLRGPKGPPYGAPKSASTTATSVTMVEANSRAGGRRSLSLSPRPVGTSSKTKQADLPPLPAFALNFDSSGPPSPTFSQVSVAAPSMSARSARSNGSSLKGSPYSVGLTAALANASGASATTGTSPGTTAAAAKRSQKPGGISLASALMQASHAEALKGGTADLLSILERPDSRPWGFSYTDVRQHVKVWYGDRDERIGISSVKWMERAMKDCEVKIIKGEDHGLLTNAKVVVEVLESIAAEWK